MLSIIFFSYRVSFYRLILIRMRLLLTSIQQLLDFIQEPIAPQINIKNPHFLAVTFFKIKVSSDCLYIVSRIESSLSYKGSQIQSIVQRNKSMKGIR